MCGFIVKRDREYSKDELLLLENSALKIWYLMQKAGTIKSYNKLYLKFMISFYLVLHCGGLY